MENIKTLPWLTKLELRRSQIPEFYYFNLKKYFLIFLLP
jgi:hypothetical protein